MINVVTCKSLYSVDFVLRYWCTFCPTLSFKLSIGEPPNERENWVKSGMWISKKNILFAVQYPIKFWSWGKAKLFKVVKKIYAGEKENRMQTSWTEKWEKKLNMGSTNSGWVVKWKRGRCQISWQLYHNPYALSRRLVLFRTLWWQKKGPGIIWSKTLVVKRDKEGCQDVT